MLIFCWGNDPSLFADQPADSLIRILPYADDTNKVELYHQLSRIYGDKDRRTSIQYGRQGLAIARRLGALDLQAKMLVRVAASLVGMADYRNAIILANECYWMNDKLGQERGKSVALNILGNSHFMIGNFDSALYYHNRALALRQKLGDIELIGSSYNNIGMLYSNLGLYDEAMQFFNRSIVEKLKIKNYEGVLRSQSNIGLIYLKRKEFDSSFAVYKIVYDSSNLVTYPGGRALGAMGIGTILTNKKKYEEALEYFLEAQKIFTRSSEVNGILECRVNIGRVYAKMNRIKAARSILQETYAYAVASSSRLRAEESAFLLAELFTKEKKYQEALRYHDISRRYKDSISVENLAREEAKIHMAARKESHDKEKRILTNQQTIRTLTIDRNNLIIGILAAGLLAIMTVIMGLSLRHRSILRNKAELEKKNAAIENQKNELEHAVAQLQESLAHVKTLSGFLPICGSCKKIRDDDGYWRQVESYVARRTDATFSHGICPDCVAKLYPDVALKRAKKDG